MHVGLDKNRVSGFTSPLKKEGCIIGAREWRDGSEVLKATGKPFIIKAKKPKVIKEHKPKPLGRPPKPHVEKPASLKPERRVEKPASLKPEHHRVNAPRTRPYGEITLELLGHIEASPTGLSTKEIAKLVGRTPPEISSTRTRLIKQGVLELTGEKRGASGVVRATGKKFVPGGTGRKKWTLN
jgi:hypothetical protein